MPIMYETVTIPFRDATNFSTHDSPVPIIKKPVPRFSSAYMLSSTMSARRTPNSALAKSDVIQAPNGSSHWRLDSSGQLVDNTEWELAEEIVKLQIGGDGLENQESPIDTASQTSLDSTSTNSLAQTVNMVSHSRESSADTTGSRGSGLSSASQNLRAPPVTPLKVGALGESRNRPHSYSGGLSSTDLIRLQQAGGSPGNTDTWSSPHGTPERPAQSEQPTYPSLLASHNGTPTRLSEQHMHSQEELSADFQGQQRQFNPAPHNIPISPAGAPTTFVHGRPPNVATNIPYRQPPPRGFNPAIPPVVPNPTNFAGYPAPVHPAAIAVANPQQELYNIMLPTPPLDNPTMARLQQQSGVFQRTHQHSASDPASLRDPATLALLNNAFAAGQMYPTMAPPALNMFQNQFYGAPGTEPYPSPELAAAQMMAQLQAQYTGQYGVPLSAQSMAMNNTGGSSHTNGNSGNGPSANNRKLGLYKTELCRSWEEKGSCRYGAKCQFAHGEEELRKVQRHPKYKTEICRTFWVSGSCPYGKRCCFIHTELPASGPPGADGAPPPANPDGRARSSSTNSDPNEASSSLLARISAKRTQENAMGSGSGSVSSTPPSAGFQVGGRPESLRVNTNLADPSISKQNKSAYPTFAHNGILMASGEETGARSPGPVTAGPDFGRHASSRLDIVGTQRGGPKTAVNPNVRHSFNGSDIQLDLGSVTTTPTAANPNSQLNASQEPPKVSRINGHVRSGSAGNWATATRSSHLAAYPLSSIPGNELKANSPWAEYSVGSSRLAEKNWV